MLRMRLLGRFSLLAALVAATVSCGDVVRQGRSPMALVVDSLQGVAGKVGGAGTPAGTLLSDVQALIKTPDPCTATNPCPTVFDDSGTMALRLVAKDVSVGPTANNQVTITRYHVKYTRADGRNTQGVDVPFEFDGAATVTVPSSGAVTLGFELVRHVAKEESPLKQLIANASIIHTIADVTVYGTDQVGNAISATGSISIEFGDFGDQ